ncbi:cold shock CspA family protein [Barrientosiimonas humi]|uniref:Cold shock CspA family protein n=2 Tax=Barrientosiimonas TaxID=1535207 RepID=A0A542XDF3_9MICO|nr:MULTISPECIES: cold-shock protein [Barrientosiimonas]TQL33776.1 cold shock CspA family protein [Barrientosiimonas humi]BDZ58717.1 hypothetical protein GCM10025872_23740 [Barrientosiimonas endolithica]CAG7573764.1 hypothetical protein BH39T_PBIAJDOK_02402 [Barrientosiimonas humi]
MQATVHTFDLDTASGSVLMDNGRELRFGQTAFAASGLRHLRPGQRVSVEIGSDGGVSRLWIVGIGAGQIIR